jgi:hypothetical protein
VDTALRTEDIAAILTSQGVSRLLVIVDTCYAATSTTAMVLGMADRLRPTGSRMRRPTVVSRWHSRSSRRRGRGNWPTRVGSPARSRRRSAITDE